MTAVAYFVSPHGFGHAARACAVMAELMRRRPGTMFEVFTAVPKWFFDESLPTGFTYHECACDVGLVQASPLVEDLDATVDLLDRQWGEGSAAERLGEELCRLECALVIVDIAPLGLAAANSVGIPTVLIENFTWDWIYAHYSAAPRRLRQHGLMLAEKSASAELRIQAEPFCQGSPTGISVAPIARRAQHGRAQVRSTLGVPDDEPMVVVSMGGVRWNYGDFAALEHVDGAWVVVPGGSEHSLERRGRMILLPFHADIFHPDLVAASDVVVSKLGYSTVAEAYRAGAALAFVGRPHFPESPVLARWVEDTMVASEMDERSLTDGSWLEVVDALLTRPRRGPDRENGAETAAQIVLEKFGRVLD